MVEFRGKIRCRSKTPPWITSRGYLHCRECGGEISITSGTVFERTRKPLRVWFQTMWLVTSQKHGTSALGLQRVLGLGSYQTAWTWLHKLRRAMVRPGRERLHGSVEVDETYVGGEEKGGKRGRGTENKEIVVIAVEVLIPKGFGRLPDVSSDSLVPFICEAVESGSEILTDGWSGYNSLSEHSYTHSRTVLSETGDPAHMARPIKNVPLVLTQNEFETISLNHERRNASYHGISSACRRCSIGWHDQNCGRGGIWY